MKWPGGRRRVLLALAHAYGPSCHYCRVIPPTLWELTIDHIWPRKYGGRNIRVNLVLACLACNNAFGHEPVKCSCPRCRHARNWGALKTGHVLGVV